MEVASPRVAGWLLCLQQCALISIGPLQLVYSPRNAVTLIKGEVLKVVEKRGSRWLWSFFSTKQFYWFLAVYLVPMLTVQVIVSSISTALFNATIVFLLIATVQTVINSEVVESRIEYLSLFQYFNKHKGPIKMPVLDNSGASYYVEFIGGVAMGVVFLGFSNHSFVYYELLAFISMIVSALVLLQYDLYESPFLWLCVLAKAPSWLTLGMEKLCSLVGQPPPRLLNFMREPILTIPLLDELFFDVNSVTLLQIFFHLCVLVVFLAKLKDKFRNPGPHILFLGWFVLSRNFIAMSSATHLAVVSTFVVLFPFYALAFFLTPFYFLLYYGLSPPFYYSLESIGIMAVVAMLIWFSYKRKKEWWMNLSIEYVLLLCLAACFCVVMFLSGWYASVFNVTKPLPSVSLEEYADYCGPGNWVNGNSIQTQINCVHMQGRVMNGHADVDTISISSIQNSRADSILFLPYFLERAIACHLGKSEPMCGDHANMSTCVYTGCHFQHSLTYTFEIKLVVPLSSHSSIKATMLVSHRYKDFVMKLESGFSLRFNATLVDGMGSGHLTLQARSLSAPELENTRDLDKEKESEVRDGMWSVFLQSIKNSAMMIFEVFFGYAT